jgi:hypothetical protein
LSALQFSGIARAGGGIAEYAYGKEPVSPKVRRILKRIFQPRVDNVSLDWGVLAEQKPILAPAQLPPVYDADCMTLFGFFQGPLPDKSITVSLKAQLGEKLGQLNIPIVLQPTNGVSNCLTNFIIIIFFLVANYFVFRILTRF